MWLGKFMVSFLGDFEPLPAPWVQGRMRGLEGDAPFGAKVVGRGSLGEDPEGVAASRLGSGGRSGSGFLTSPRALSASGPGGLRSGVQRRLMRL